MTPVYGIDADKLRRNTPAALRLRFVLSWITKLTLCFVVLGGLLALISVIETATTPAPITQLP